nr:unnamed protein product [Callosobruchus analis]
MGDQEHLQASLNFILLQLLKFSNALQNKCARLMEQNDSNIEFDINCIEDVALKLVKTLRNSKGNILALLAFMENDIKQLNATRQSALFNEVTEKIRETQTSSVIIENGNVVFKQPVDKGIMVNLDVVVANQDTIHERYA